MPSKVKRAELEGLIKEIVRGILKEMTTTGDVSGFNIPAAFARKGGSKGGVAGSKAIGYNLTKAGEEEMNRPADRLIE
jgi:hypothetical protein